MFRCEMYKVPVTCPSRPPILWPTISLSIRLHCATSAKSHFTFVEWYPRIFVQDCIYKIHISCKEAHNAVANNTLLSIFYCSSNATSISKSHQAILACNEMLTRKLHSIATSFLRERRFIFVTNRRPGQS